MELKIGSVYHGFLIKEKEFIADIRGEAHLLEHLKSGARLLYIKTKDENKVFSISFKTPPEDDCGTPHILEHSVLCGSRKYASKDPFNELAKGSLNTFLNALTYSDKTMYPVASCNEEDFHNLMDVYLDAVFYPNIYEKKEIFMQEGWRYLFDKETGKLDVTGVVYNEMKGALSDPESLLQGAISRGLFGKTTYGFESGGDPTAIPDLSYEAFLEFHKKYYHPSNSYVYLYGDMDIERCLAHIGEEYLSNFMRTSNLPEIEAVTELPEESVSFEVFPSDSSDEKGYLAYSANVGLCTDEELTIALQILSYVLLETNASVIKTALMDAKICDEVEGWLDTSTYEMAFSIVAKNADITKVGEFEEIIQKTLKNVLNEGLDQALLDASIRRLAFLLKEEDYGSTPKGLIYGMKVMKSWLHGKSPFPCLRHFEVLERIKNPAYDWNGVIKKCLLNNGKKNILVFSPDVAKEQALQNAFNKKMERISASFTDEDIQRMEEEMERLEQFQKIEDTPEILAQIPILKIEQISTTPKPTEYHKSEAGGIPQIYVPMKSNGILYAKFHFDTSGLTEELLPYAGLLSDVLGKIDTEKYSYQELPMLTNKILGGLSFHNDVFNENTKQYSAFLTMKVKFLVEDFVEAAEIMKEILLNSKYSALESLKKIVRAAKIKGENYLLNYSHYEAIYYSMAQLSAGEKVNEMTNGIEYYHFLCKIDQLLSTSPEEVMDALKKVSEVLFTRENLRFSFGSDEHNFDKGEFLRGYIYDRLKQGTHLKTEQGQFMQKPLSIAFTANSTVQYNIFSADYAKLGWSYNGTLQVLKTILSLEYLWNEVRIKGGAYGSGCNFQKNGLCYFYSYRDPNIKTTFDVYNNLWEKIQNFDASNREMTKYILGTINRLDQPKTNIDLLNEAVYKVFCKEPPNSVILERTEILNTTIQDIASLGELLNQITETKNYCTIGNETKINAEKTLFSSIEKLIP